METKQGGCHCKRVRYETEIDLTNAVIECNCSICEIKGLLLAFVTQDKMTILSGEDILTEYRFNTEKITHLFCKVCGTEPFGRGKDAEGADTYAVNVRTIDGITLSELERMSYDGRAL